MYGLTTLGHMDPRAADTVAVAAAERAAAPWWPRCLIAGVVQLVLTAGLAGYVLVTAEPPALGVINRVSTLGTGAGIVLAVGAVVLAVTVLLIVRRVLAGPAVLVMCGMLLATVSGALTLGVWGGKLIDTLSGALIVGTFILSVLVTIVAAATTGRILRVSRARSRIGLRQF